MTIISGSFSNKMEHGLSSRGSINYTDKICFFNNSYLILSVLISSIFLSSNPMTVALKW